MKILTAAEIINEENDQFIKSAKNAFIKRLKNWDWEDPLVFPKKRSFPKKLRPESKPRSEGERQAFLKVKNHFR